MSCDALQIPCNCHTVGASLSFQVTWALTCSCMLRRVTAVAGFRRRGRVADPAEPCKPEADDLPPSPFLPRHTVLVMCGHIVFTGNSQDSNTTVDC